MVWVWVLRRRRRRTDAEPDAEPDAVIQTLSSRMWEKTDPE